MKILGKTYDNADFRTILRNSLKKVKKNLGKTYDNCKAVLENCDIDYTVVLYVNKNNNNGVHVSIHTFTTRRK